MLMTAQTSVSNLPAVVARIVHGATGPTYLKQSPSGELDWVQDPESATPFDSMREATRHASRLPAKLRAFGIVRGRLAA
jgi:hypothetical protein